MGGGVSDNMHTLETVAILCFVMYRLLKTLKKELNCAICLSQTVNWVRAEKNTRPRVQFSFSVLRALISNTKNSNQTTPELLVKSSRTTKHAENTSPSSFNYLTSAFIALVPPCPHFIWLGLLIFMSHVERVAQEVFRSQWWCWRSQLFFFLVGPP